MSQKILQQLLQASSALLQAAEHALQAHHMAPNMGATNSTEAPHHLCRYNLFGKERAKRQLFEADEADIDPLAQRFPLRAGGGTLIYSQSAEAQEKVGAVRTASDEAGAEADAVMHASGGRKGRFL